LPDLFRGLGSDRGQRILSVTLLSIMTLFLVTLLSQWVQDRRYQIRYFLPIIFLSGFFAIYGIAKLRLRIFHFLLGTLALVGLISLYVDQHIRFDIPDWAYDPADLRDQDQIKESNILGSYWTSYVMAAQLGPGSLGTANDQEQVRHEPSVVKVMGSDTILVVGNRWLKSGIDTSLEQFGWKLRRIGQEEHLGKLYYAYFVKDRMINSYDLVSDCWSDHITSDSTNGYFRFHIEEARQVRIVERGRIYLEQGSYAIRIQGRTLTEKGKLLVTARRGAPSSIYSDTVFDLKKSMQDFELTFNVDEAVGFFEFNISIKGTSDAELSSLELYKLD